jgi:hypothetical protein
MVNGGVNDYVKVNEIKTIDVSLNLPELVLVHFLPPLTPPFGANKNAQLWMPAVRNVCVSVQVVEAVSALLIAVRFAFENGVLRQMLEFQRQFFIDFFGLGLGQIVSHGANHTAPRELLKGSGIDVVTL